MKSDLYSENSFCVDVKAWEKKAKAFAIRSHDHLWGKNNEDPLSFLYIKGLNLNFISKMYIGWNKFGHNRPCEGWGLSCKDSFFIPSGIVFPYLVGKKITGVFIISMENPDDEPASELIIPGSFKGPLVLGPGNREVKNATGIMEGLKIFQEDPDVFSVNIPL
ncbi:hypothetical protein DO021_20960 [Desulfobacter hydrogenophilus]|uniref:Uncharacterized protein n=1 Tax=Desulfobacter hydrogenophilus TaxID=2291 RepID=A0A328F8W9_9BACT|nr:hypothetical protein [Desulfobacter hydrogenophilus]NDY74369.1 hypothetical protein [Desulfobacter hydrogenophilus]QBH12611.1 hypothetical protein EYB58_06605 [Desulfobacter hydrogenophilus]RAM00090.1 hypothetical protein DO021_20960 [Desulfobacter hydrogenophilus]